MKYSRDKDRLVTSVSALIKRNLEHRNTHMHTKHLWKCLNWEMIKLLISLLFIL